MTIPEDHEPCPLCGRPDAIMSAHHLIPKSRGGLDTVLICSDCHSAIHARYTNKELEEKYYRLDLLQTDVDLQRAFKFVSKQKSYRRFRNRRSNHRKRR
jgi:5-methylcytosine-specific restriction endonuclease McrA